MSRELVRDLCSGFGDEELQERDMPMSNAMLKYEEVKLARKDEVALQGGPVEERVATVK